MKNKIIILLLGVLGISIYSQTPIISPFTNLYDITQGAYLKDSNGNLNKFVGTWIGTFNNKTLIIYMKKFEMSQNSYLNDSLQEITYYEDCVSGRYKLIDNNGQILKDYSNDVDTNYSIAGGGMTWGINGSQLNGGYGEPENSFTFCDIIIKVDNATNPNSMSIYLYNKEFLEFRPNAVNIEFALPLGQEIILYKQ